MPTYDFHCIKCGKLEEVEMKMKDVGVVKVYCKPCNPHIDEWIMLSFLSDEELKKLNLVEMERYYNPAQVPKGIVKGGTFGSLMDTKKFKATNHRPEDFFIEQKEKKRESSESEPYRKIKIKDA